MSKFKVAITDHVFPDLEFEKAELAKIGAELVDAPGVSEDDIISVAADADAVYVCYAELTRRVIMSLTKCRVIARSGIGYNNIDLATATERGIKVTYVPDYCIEEVSDHALALLLALARRIPMLERVAKLERKWSLDSQRPMYRLKGKALGLIGFGRIARELARKASPLGLTILASDPYLPPAAFEEAGAEMSSVETILRQADYISLHAPLTPETKHMINAASLQLMKPSACLINTSRGPLIDEAALYAALKERRIAAAGLDVLENELSIADNPLLSLDNAIVTPHAAYYSVEAIAELRAKNIDEVVRALTGQPPRVLLNKEVLAKTQ